MFRFREIFITLIIAVSATWILVLLRTGDEPAVVTPAVEEEAPEEPAIVPEDTEVAEFEEPALPAERWQVSGCDEVGPFGRP